MGIKKRVWIIILIFFMSVLIVSSLAFNIFFQNTKASPSETMGLNSFTTLFANDFADSNNISDTYVYNWTHQGINYLTNFSISKNDYVFYKDQKRTWCCDTWKKYVTPNDPTIEQIVNDIKNISLTTKDNDAISAAIDFAESAKYQTDKDYNGQDNYPKYPIETIVDGRGDCEDTAFLTASLLKDLGIRTVLLYYQHHVAVGIDCENSINSTENGTELNCTGTYFMHEGIKYYFLETTAGPDRWKIGLANQKFIDETPKIEEV